MGRYKFCISMFVVLTISYLNCYELKCPSPSQWNVRAFLKCTPSSKSNLYNCLWSNLTSTYKEYCGSEEVSKYGNKYILMPNPQQVLCSRSYYQPFKFTSLGNSRCIFMKSMCNEQGQVTVGDESAQSDRICRCNYTQSYAFVRPTKNRCTCVPSEEDCSCVLKPCVGLNEKMGRDYACYNTDEDVIPERIPCEDIISNFIPNSKQSTYVSRNIPGILIIRRVPLTLVQLLILILIVFIMTFAVLFVHVFPVGDFIEVTTNFDIQNETEDNVYKVLDMEDVTLKFKVESYFRVKSITWKIIQKGQQQEINISKDSNKYHVELSDDSRTASLTINKFTSADSGTYFCIVRNNIGLRNTKPNLGILNDLPAFKGNNSVTVKVFDCHTKEKACHFIGSDVTLKVSNENISHDIDKIIWFKRDKELSIIDPEVMPALYEGGSCEDTWLKIKDSNASNSGEYICLLLDRDRKIVNGSYWLMPIEVRPKPELSVSEEFIRSGQFEDVIKYFRKFIVASTQETRQSGIKEWHFGILLTRLATESIQNISPIPPFFHEIYRFWINQKSWNTMGSKAYIESYFPAWTLILFMEKLANNDKNSWIFKEAKLDFVVVCALILSAKNNYLKDRRDVFDMLLSQFCKRLESEDSEAFLESLGSYLDRNRNTFFHYLVLFGSDEATIILNISNALLRKNTRFIFCRSNKFHLTPLELSAFLGKSLVFKTLLIKTKHTNQKRIHLQQVIKSGLNFCYGHTMEPIVRSDQPHMNSTVDTNGTSHAKIIRLTDIKSHLQSTHLGDNEVFPQSEVCRCAVYGNKDNYLDLLVLSERELKKDIIEKELRNDFIRKDNLRPFLLK